MLLMHCTCWANQYVHALPIGSGMETTAPGPFAGCIFSGRASSPVFCTCLRREANNNTIGSRCHPCNSGSKAGAGAIRASAGCFVPTLVCAGWDFSLQPLRALGCRRTWGRCVCLDELPDCVSRTSFSLQMWSRSAFAPQQGCQSCRRRSSQPST